MSILFEDEFLMGEMFMYIFALYNYFNKYEPNLFDTFYFYE